MITDIAERVTTQCAVVVNNTYDTCGTITRASIANLTPAELEAMFVSGGLFADLDAFFYTAIEMKMCGTEVNGMYDWIMSGADRSGAFKQALRPGINIKGSGSLVQPFFHAKQESVFNNEFWVVTTGSSNSAYTPDSPSTAIGTGTAGPLTTADKALGVGSDRIIRVISRYGVELDEKYFNPRTVLHIMSRESGTGVTENGAWRVLGAAVNTTGTYIDVLVTSENTGSSQPYAAYPTSGILTIGVNNVDDYESFCYNRVNRNLNKLVPFFFQTIRRSRCKDQFYDEFVKRMMTSGVNRAYAEFGHIDAIEQNRQDEEGYQREFVNAFFFQKPFNSNQTELLWKSLPQITTPSGFGIDPGTGGKLITYRANFIGVVEQLYRCGRVQDLQGSPLNFREWLRENYRLMRSRQKRKGSQMVREIDWFTSSQYAARLETAFVSYWKEESQEQLRMSWDVTNKNDNTNALGFTWNKFRVKWPAGLQINIVTHPYFDDLLSAHDNETQAPAGNLLLALDIGKPGVQGRGGSIYWAHMASNKRTSTLGELDDLEKIDRDWSCVLKSTKVEQMRQSDTGTVIVECPQDNSWIWGIGDSDIVTSGETYPYSDLV